MHGRCSGGVQKVHGRCAEGVREVRGRCTGGVWEVCGGGPLANEIHFRCTEGA